MLQIDTVQCKEGQLLKFKTLNELQIQILVFSKAIPEKLKSQRGPSSDFLPTVIRLYDRFLLT